MASLSVDVRVSTLAVNEGDVLFCSREAEKYLNEVVVGKVSEIVCETGFFGRVLGHSILKKEFLRENLHKICVVSKRDFRSKLVSSLKERYRIESKLIAITGTKGKTSTCWFICQLLSRCGFSCGYIGTLGVFFFERELCEPKSIAGVSLTTPDLGDLYVYLNRLSSMGADFIVFEASSHALAQGRLSGIKVDCACFTNLSQDHLDYHGTMRKYFFAKKKLFAEKLKKNAIVILNNDSKAECKSLQRLCEKKNIDRCFTFGKRKQSNLRILSDSLTDGSRIVNFEFLGKKYVFTTNIIGEFQVYNIALASFVCNVVAGIAMQNICKIIQSLKAPIGRMEVLSTKNTKAVFIVDFAHSPKSLEESLLSLREIYKNIVVVFGCGGDRDRKKRPIMFEIAKHLASTVIITDDNPRTENREQIFNDILSYHLKKDNFLLQDEFVRGEIDAIRKKYDVKKGGDKDDFEPIIINDRHEAIRFAVNNFKNLQDTCVLIAGKGHENYQIIGQTKTHFSDKEEVESNL